MRATRHLGLVTAIGRSIDRSVCNGAVANAARSVSQDRERADQRRDAWLAVHRVEAQPEFPAPRVTLPSPRRTG
jgi:hypothetical protein